MERDLIYDVGLHNGDDTAFYLRQGYRVVAVEANLALVEAGRERFAAEIAAEKVCIIEAAIGPAHHRTSFWISSNPEYSSFDRQNAVKWDNTAREIEVECRPLETILAEHGTPYYLKIDIEGADHHCLRAIDRNDPPAYVSFEKGRLEDLIFAHSIGYSRFKLIDQESMQQYSFGEELRRAASPLRHLGRLRYAVERRLNRQDAEDGRLAEYAYGSSGPFGEETDGPWRSMEEVAFTWLAYDLGHTSWPDPARTDWFDVHCAR